MKVCIPSTDRQIPRHFGKAREFALVIVEDGRFVSGEVVPNPGRDRAKVPVFLSVFGITHVVAAGIGNPAIAILNEHGIEVCSGVTGSVDDALKHFIAGDLKGKKMSCAGENRCGAQHPKD